MAIIINKEECNGCGACMNACNVGAIYLVDEKAFVDQERCTSCGNCIEVCPVQVIQSVESVIVQQTQPVEIQPARISVLPTIKAAVVTVGSSLLPVLISKIGDILSAKLESKPDRSVLPRRRTYASGRYKRRRFRGGK